MIVPEQTPRENLTRGAGVQLHTFNIREQGARLVADTGMCSGEYGVSFNAVVNAASTSRTSSSGPPMLCLNDSEMRYVIVGLYVPS